MKFYRVFSAKNIAISSQFYRCISIYQSDMNEALLSFFEHVASVRYFDLTKLIKGLLPAML